METAVLLFGQRQVVARHDTATYQGCQETDILVRVGQRLQWSQPGRVVEFEVYPAKRVDQDLQAPVLVEQDNRRAKSLGLADDERHPCRLAGARTTTQEGIANVADLEMEEIRNAAA